MPYRIPLSEVRSKETKGKKQTLDELKRQCMVLIELIEEAKEAI